MGFRDNNWGCGFHTGDPMLEREVSTASSHASAGEDDQNGEEQAPPGVSTDKPARVMFPNDLTVMQVDCGTFHTGESLPKAEG